MSRPHLFVVLPVSVEKSSSIHAILYDTKGRKLDVSVDYVTSNQESHAKVNFLRLCSVVEKDRVALDSRLFEVLELRFL